MEELEFRWDIWADTGMVHANILIRTAGKRCTLDSVYSEPVPYGGSHENRRHSCLSFAFSAIAGFQASSAQSPAKKFLTADGSRPTGLFAPGLTVGKTVYIAGKGDYRPNEDFPNKVRNCLAEVEKASRWPGLT